MVDEGKKSIESIQQQNEMGNFVKLLIFDFFCDSFKRLSGVDIDDDGDDIFYNQLTKLFSFTNQKKNLNLNLPSYHHHHHYYSDLICSYVKSKKEKKTINKNHSIQQISKIIPSMKVV